MKTIITACLFVCCLLVQTSHAQKNKKSKGNSLFGVNVKTTSDKFEGTTTYSMEGNKVKINGGVGNTVVKGVLGLLKKDLKVSIITTRLNLENHITKDGTSQLSIILKVSLDDNGIFRVMEGESLVFLVDGERLGFSTDGAFNSDDFIIDGSNSKTHARYSITPEELKLISNAKEVEFRIMQDGFEHGEAEARDKKDTSFEGAFKKKNFKAWKDFYENYVISTPKK